MGQRLNGFCAITEHRRRGLYTGINLSLEAQRSFRRTPTDLRSGNESRRWGKLLDWYINGRLDRLIRLHVYSYTHINVLVRKDIVTILILHPYARLLIHRFERPNVPPGPSPQTRHHSKTLEGRPTKVQRCL